MSIIAFDHMSKNSAYIEVQFIFFLFSSLVLCFLPHENHLGHFQDFRQLLRDGRLKHYSLVLLIYTP